LTFRVYTVYDRKLEMKKKKTTSKLVMISVKLSPKDLKRLKAIARKCTDGNVSKLLLTSAFVYTQK
jgi:hypothetical protein